VCFKFYEVGINLPRVYLLVKLYSLRRDLISLRSRIASSLLHTRCSIIVAAIDSAVSIIIISM
jgi:hypothetical protein